MTEFNPENLKFLYTAKMYHFLTFSSNYFKFGNKLYIKTPST
jgi:hypothetical protein